MTVDWYEIRTMMERERRALWIERIWDFRGDVKLWLWLVIGYRVEKMREEVKGVTMEMISDCGSDVKLVLRLLIECNFEVGTKRWKAICMKMQYGEERGSGGKLSGMSWESILVVRLEIGLRLGFRMGLGWWEESEMNENTIWKRRRGSNGWVDEKRGYVDGGDGVRFGTWDCVWDRELGAKRRGEERWNAYNNPINYMFRAVYVIN